MLNLLFHGKIRLKSKVEQWVKINNMNILTLEIIKEFIPYVFSAVAGLWSTYVYLSNKKKRKADLADIFVDTALDLTNGLRVELNRVIESNNALMLSNNKLIRSNVDLVDKVNNLETELRLVQIELEESKVAISQLTDELGAVVLENLKYKEIHKKLN